MSEERMKWVDKFHAHLDSCKQCREQPFNLCLEGHTILTNPPSEVNPFSSMIKKEEKEK